MAEPLLKYVFMVAAGMLLGAVFFGGLWLTVHSLPRSRHPVLLVISSVVLRTVIVLAGIWYCAGSDALAMAACLAGFVGVRALSTRGAVVPAGGKEAL